MPTTAPIADQCPIATTPGDGWRWSQHWRDVLFLHWPAASDWLRQRIPTSLEIDTYRGQAWVSFVGFRLEQVQLHGWPQFPLLSSMLELNFRTYVRYQGEPAIYFLTMHADHRWLVAAARWLTPLPYALATLGYAKRDALLDFHCTPRAQQLPLLTAKLHTSDETDFAAPDSLDAWLLERYVAYAGDRRQRLYRMAVTHEPWRLQRVELRQLEQRLDPAVLAIPDEAPLCHFSAGVSARLWPFSRA